MPITAFFAALCGILLIALTLRVALYRHGERVSSGDAADLTFARWIRAHGNAVEQIPITLILMGLAESLRVPSWPLILIGTMLLTGRVLHAWHFSFKGVPMLARASGMILTMSAQVIASLTILINLI